MSSSSDSLEDRAFGPPEPPPLRSPTIAVATWPETAAAYMLPLTATVVLVLASSYALSKSIQYQELFQGNARYRSGLLAVNGATILFAVTLVAWGVRVETIAAAMRQQQAAGCEEPT